MKVLAIGNSFSQDAMRYLHKMALCNGEKLKAVNLYIGGCSLKKHYYNILENNKAYMFEFNGENTGIFVTVKEALMSDNWDYITLQQVSQEAPDYSTYQPYLNVLAEYVRKYCPHSKILMHQTWAYERDSYRLVNELKYEIPEKMTEDIVNSYDQAAKDIGAYGIIPCGEVFMKAIEKGIMKIHRDTFHAHLGIGRYALALTWFAYLYKCDPLDVKFDAFDVETDEMEIQIVKETVKEVLKR